MIVGIWEVLIIICVLITAVLWYANYLNKYFKRRGILCAKNPKLILGHMSNVFLGKEHLRDTVYKVCNDQPQNRYIGFYAFNRPTVIINDADLIKLITVRDFDHFIDHKVFMDEEDDPLFGRNLFFLKGQKWRDMRLAMSPAYTGSKMKNMLPLITECAEQIIEDLKSQLLQNGDDILTIEMKDVFTRFTNDVIASTAFGVRVNSMKDKKNKFYLMGKKATNFSGIQFFKFFGFSSCPKLMKLFGISLFPKDVATFFRNLIRDAIESREKFNLSRHDMIHLLMLAKKGSLSYEYDPLYSDDVEFTNYKFANLKENSPKREWTHDDLTAQAVAFLLAGFDTSSSLLCFTAYELALNRDIQKRLQMEIDEINTILNGKITYAELHKLKYLDMVISEVLRMWPPDSQLERVCVKSYTLPPQNSSNNVSLEINKDDDIWIPVYSIHHNPKYHPNPDKFDPERFSAENKILMQPFTYLPFGAGPRLCIGARFAVMEAKAMIFYLLSSFEIITNSKTVIPVKIAADTFTLQAENGLWLGLKLRS